MPDRLPYGAARHGAALAAPVTSRMTTGVVIEVHPATQSYRVRTAFGELREVPRICRDPGDNVLLPTNTVVVLHNELDGRWHIDGVLKQMPTLERNLNQVRVTNVPNVGGSDPQQELTEGAANFSAPGDPVDMLPNDWVRHSGDGNFSGVLSGGMNVMHSAPFAQIRTHAVTNSVEILAHEYRHVSSMGDLEIKNDGGKTSLTWRAGSDQSTENGADATNWTFRLDVGAEGNLFRFRVTAPGGQTLSEVHISPDGKMALTNMGGTDVTTTGYREDVLEDRTAVTHGNQAQTVMGVETHVVGAARATRVTQNDELTVGGGQATSVTGNQVLTIGGSLTQSIGASSRIDINSGYLDVVLGDPAKLGTEPGPLCFVNFKGDVQVKPGPAGGKFTAFGSLPGSVELGADAISSPRPDGSMGTSSSAQYSAMLFEQFQSMMSAFLNWADTHTHPTAVGPSSTALPPAGAIVNPLLTPIQSLRVKLGG